MTTFDDLRKGAVRRSGICKGCGRPFGPIRGSLAMSLTALQPPERQEVLTTVRRRFCEDCSTDLFELLEWTIDHYEREDVQRSEGPRGQAG